MKIVNIHELKRLRITPEGQPMKPHSVVVPFFKKQDGVSFTMRFHTILPNDEPDPSLNTHSWDHQTFTISGRGAILTEKGEFPITEGQVVFIPPNEPHVMVCRGEIPWVCLDCTSYVYPDT